MGRIGNFDDIIGHFSQKYDAYIVENWENDETGSRKNCYKKVKIWGSLQTEGRKKVVSSEGASSIEHSYTLYSNKRYILNEGDYVKDKIGNILIVVGLDDWELEGDYRKYSLIRTGYTEKRLLEEFKGDINPDADISNPELKQLLEERILR